MLRIGILGGTFNPIHNGHLLMAEGVFAKLKLDRILFIPCAIPPHKKSVKLVSAKHRLKMVSLAVKNNQCFKACKIEINRPGRSYSVDTLKQLIESYGPKVKFYFIIGSDNLGSFCTWKDPKDLLKSSALVAVNRPGTLLSKSRRRRSGSLRQLTNKTNSAIKLIYIPTLPVSSSKIRSLVKRGASIRYMVPEDVLEYIKVNELYCG